jgi:hypothetical protein
MQLTAGATMHDVPSVVIAGHQKIGSGVAELWCGSALLGILHEENGGIVLRLESHARGPLTVNAVALERALAEARERLAVAAPRRARCHESTPRPVCADARSSDADGRGGSADASEPHNQRGTP